MFFSAVVLASTLTWSSFSAPERVPPRPIGLYSNGCLAGAVAADFNNPYYQVIRQQNRRYYGDPSLIAYLDSLANKAHEAGLPILLVGDMSMPRGGPFKGGHASHQIGLDVDIWYRMEKQPLAKHELNKPWALNIVADNFLEVNRFYSPKILTLIRLAASDERVERIFVNPAIKKQLCLDTPKEEREWLHKVRPWWGHNAHLHVRLVCPPGASSCQKAPAIPTAGDGCGAEVEAWLEDIRHPKPKQKPATPLPKPIKLLPRECQKMLERS